MFRLNILILLLLLCSCWSLICGLSLHPKPPRTNVESIFIWYNSSDPNNYKYWVDEAKKFLKSYEDLPKTHQISCDFDNLPEENEVCGFDPNSFAPCNERNNFGYNTNRPCLFLRFDEISNWTPEIYNDSKTLPDEMPDGLKQHIKAKQTLRPNEMDVVWVTCEGENIADVINLKSRAFYPRMGFPHFYFPFKNIEGYVPPIVAVQFTIPTGVVVQIECKAWARNLDEDGTSKRGSLHFELMID